MLLENEHIKLRALEPEDLDILYRWENDTSLWIHGNTLSPYSKLTLRQYINDSLTQDVFQSKQLRMMVCLKEDNRTIGTIDLFDFDHHAGKAGIGILIDENFRGKNYASEVLQIIQDYAFNFLNLHQIYAYISCDNQISINLFSKAGYIETARLKDWIKVKATFLDVLVMQLVLSNEYE